VAREEEREAEERREEGRESRMNGAKEERAVERERGRD